MFKVEYKRGRKRTWYAVFQRSNNSDKLNYVPLLLVHLGQRAMFSFVSPVSLFLSFFSIVSHLEGSCTRKEGLSERKKKKKTVHPHFSGPLRKRNGGKTYRWANFPCFVVSTTMLCACGITSFLTPLPACAAAPDAELNGTASSPLRCATGDIKATPEDFIVVEIDPTGQRTDADSYVFPDVDVPGTTTSTHGAAGKDVDDNEEDPTREEVNSRGEVSLSHKTAVVGDEVRPVRSVRDLHHILTDNAPVLHSLFGSAADVAERVCTTFTSADLTTLIRDAQLSAQGALPPVSGSNEVTASTAWWRGRHYLGEFTDKTERQVLHLLVRRCFPHLHSCAEVSSTSSAVASLISCSMDLHYVLFCATLGTEAARCIAQWAVAAQAARQERNLDEESRRELQLVSPVDDGARPASMSKGVCFASFDALTETMRRPVKEETPTSENVNALRDQTVSGEGTSSFTVAAGSGEPTPLLSDKDVRRHVHDTLRRFYPFLRCQVRDGQVVLRYNPKPGPTNHDPATAAAASRLPSSSSSADGSVPSGTRRPRDGDGGEGEGTERKKATTDTTASFIHFVVQKRNLDTAEMRQLVGEFCGVADGSVCAAGMKDKKAVTTQRCSIPRMSTSTAAQRGCIALAAATTASPVVLRWPADPQNSYITVLGAAPRSAPVHLGQLQGNWFAVQVRNVRWATFAERQTWKNLRNAQVVGDKEEGPEDNATAGVASDTSALRTFLEGRFRRCVERGFVNYFGQQRFGETIARADDHTGVHLFAGRWVDAVKSLFRGCPDVYDAFPEKMEARFVPGNSRDAQAMTHALRQTYRMYFSEHVLTRDDVLTSSALWTRLCEKAITEGVAYFLRSLWVHAGQSVFFNLTASFVVDGLERTPPSPPLPPLFTSDGSNNCTASALPPLSYAIVAKARLPLGGYQVHHTTPTGDGGDDGAAWDAWRTAAIEHALRTLRWTHGQAFEQRKVAGVPVPGSWRAVVVRPQDAALQWTESDQSRTTSSPPDASELPSMELSFGLPSSSYATIFMREVLGCDKWW